MKTKLFFLTLLLGFGLSFNQANAQCNDQLLEEAFENMDDYVYLKDFKVKLEQGRRNRDIPSSTFTVILTKNMKYRLIGLSAEDYDGQLIFDLYSQEGKVVSSYENGKHYKSVDYICQKTGLYHVVLYFKDGAEGCGACVLAFKNKEEGHNWRPNNDE